MKVGLVVPQFGINSTKENLINFVQIAESEGFESLWVYDRMLYAINPQQPYPGTPNKREWPEYFKNNLNPLTTLAFIAANTSKTNLGTCIIDILFHNPITLAKEFTTIDILSGGRVICGFGIGWSKDEYLAANIPYKKRGERANEILRAMKKVWKDDIVEFNGDFYKIPKSIINPKPIQKPHPKILLGGFSQQTFERMVKYGDGYIGALAGSFEYFHNLIKMFNDSIDKGSRTRKDFDLTILTYPYLMKSTSEKSNRSPMTGGTIDEIGSDLSKLKSSGVDRVILAVNAEKDYNVNQTIEFVKELRKFCQ
ncbi:MAG TPA: TIGR03619 family F420-dependent LLM class oxidoreductase [Nitrososphaeraceae archaeon]|jgi:probable F420-dependent oxidoreductase|nr:TIGR03619 family F420-dependent LLM class oxidoreductase [Nitrososphaeraceae archaeon]